MKTLQMHPTTRLLLESLAKSPPHALLLIGPEGAGKYSLAKAWAREITQTNFSITEIAPDEKGSIGIATIRELYGQLSSKRAGNHAVIIEDADTMGAEAQNAFLKLLEEPKQGILFVLTAPHEQSLLPTITSRVQALLVRPLESETIKHLITTKQPSVAPTELAQIMFVANGRPGIATRMLEDEAFAAKQKESMQAAKQLLGTSRYERFILASKLASDKVQTIHTLLALQRMVAMQLSKATTKKHAKQFTAMLDSIDNCLSKIAQNGNVRMQLLRLLDSY